MRSAGQLRGNAEESVCAGREGRRVAEGHRFLYVRNDDRFDRGGGDCHHRGGRLPDRENDPEVQGRGRREEGKEGCFQDQGGKQGGEGVIVVVCLLYLETKVSDFRMCKFLKEH